MPRLASRQLHLLVITAGLCASSKELVVPLPAGQIGHLAVSEVAALVEHEHNGEHSVKDMDIVYTFNSFWGDAQRKAVFQDLLENESDPDRDAQFTARPDEVKQRFGDDAVRLEELEFSLASLNMFADQIFRKVHLVVADDQLLPNWLHDFEYGGEGVTVTNHSSILPKGSALPMYNSHNIESGLHNIPNLTETFLYCNDDMMFTANVSWSDFVDEKGRSRVWTSSNKIKTGKEAFAAAIRRGQLMAQKLGAGHRDLLHHCKTMSRSMLQKGEAAFPQQYKEARAHRFRSTKDINVMVLATNLCLHQGKCVAERAPKACNWNNGLFCQRSPKGFLASDYYPKSFDTFMEYLKNQGDVKMLCVNKNTGTTKVKAALRKFFKMPDHQAHAPMPEEARQHAAASAPQLLLFLLCLGIILTLAKLKRWRAARKSNSSIK